MHIDDRNLDLEALENILSESEDEETSTSMTLERF